jgi:hypothetical protein
MAGGGRVWHLPGSELTIMWAGPGARLRIGQCLLAGGSTTTVDHPTACHGYLTAKAAEDAVAAFIASAPLQIFRVWYEVRRAGAIGVFKWTTSVVSAADAAEAKTRVFDALHAEGWETRGGARVEEAQS